MKCSKYNGTKEVRVKEDSYYLNNKQQILYETVSRDRLTVRQAYTSSLLQKKTKKKTIKLKL